MFRWINIPPSSGSICEIMSQNQFLLFFSRRLLCMTCAHWRWRTSFEISVIFSCNTLRHTSCEDYRFGTKVVQATGECYQIDKKKSILREAVKKFPTNLQHIDGSVHHWVHTAWTECCWSSLRVNLAEKAAQQVAGRDSVFCITIMYQATHGLLYHDPATAFSGPRSECLLAVLWGWTSRGGGARFAKMEDIKWNATANCWRF
jgi:hypothetical protein